MTAAEALARLEQAYERPAEIAAALAASGAKVVRVVGEDAPLATIRACGFAPVRLPPVSGETPRADAIAGRALSARGRRLLEALLHPALSDAPVLITHEDAEQPQVFAALRELRRLGELAPANVHFLDLLHTDRPSTAAYNQIRLGQLTDWLDGLGGVRSDVAAEAEGLSSVLDQLRREHPSRLSGTQMLFAAGAAAVLPPQEHRVLLEAILNDAASLPPLAGDRIGVTGSFQRSSAVYRQIEAAGFVIVADDLAAAPIKPLWLRSPEERASSFVARLTASGAAGVVHLSIDGDEAAPWDEAALRKCLPRGVRFVTARVPLNGGDKLDAALAQLRGSVLQPRPVVHAAARPKPEAGAKSRKSLASIATFNTYQREWFAEVRRRVADGEPFAVVNANAPQEILRALDIPFVVNQWWASIVAAKQQSRRYLALLRARDFPGDAEAYSAQGLAAAFDEDAELAPWGGLPRPGFLQAVLSSDPTPKIFEQWASVTGAKVFLYERTIDPRPTIRTDWWRDLPDRWDEVLEPARIDLLVAEMKTVIGDLERATGRRFSHDRFEEVMALVNEQEEHYRATRDLIAASRPAPIGVADSMPATMVPQWHRGTVWARDAAASFRSEVAERTAARQSAAPAERIRLMWVGRGMWSEMGFYQQWEESHGAVFVWSMYLALAADGYIRRYDRGRDPIRALAARFVTMGDELRMPGWAGPWHVHEAKTHGVDGAVALADADPFVIRALRLAGVPVLELGVDNFSGGEGADAVAARVTAFIEGPASQCAARRLEMAA
jgi:hypothetical protein